MHVSDFDYDLPESLIAQTPAEPRDSSRLLYLERATGVIHDHVFTDIVDLLDPNSVLVVNNSTVIPARLLGETLHGGIVEIFLVRPSGDTSWECLIRTNANKKEGLEVVFPTHPEFKAQVVKSMGYTYEVSFTLGGAEFWEVVEHIGHVPLPPYIRDGHDGPEDRTRYQTVYADPMQPGSVAAPTAGLHFTEAVLERIRAKGIVVVPVTLHVGLGTFLPVKTDEVEKHIMHDEFGLLSEENAKLLNTYRVEGRKIIAVGTTSVRVLESFFHSRHGNFVGGEKWIDIFIYPGYTFHSIDGLITNFHLPKSTLLMLVSAFAGREHVLDAYRHAIDQKYRFYSYGDAMFIR